MELTTAGKHSCHQRNSASCVCQTVQTTKIIRPGLIENISADFTPKRKTMTAHEVF